MANGRVLWMLLPLFVITALAEEPSISAEDLKLISKTISEMGIHNGQLPKGRKGHEEKLGALPARLQKGFALAVDRITDEQLKRTLASVLPGVEAPAGAGQPHVSGNTVWVEKTNLHDPVFALALLIEKELSKHGVAFRSSDTKNDGEVKLGNGQTGKLTQDNSHVPGKSRSTSTRFEGRSTQPAGGTVESAASNDRQARAYARGGWYSSAATLYEMAAGDWEKVLEKETEAVTRAALAEKAQKARARAAKAKELGAKIPDGGAGNYTRNLQELARTQGKAAFEKAMSGDWPARAGDDW